VRRKTSSAHSRRPARRGVGPEGGLFYANADNVHIAINGHIKHRTGATVLDLESVPAGFTSTDGTRYATGALTSLAVMAGLAVLLQLIDAALA
jgi:hypothetical protein